MTVDDSRSPTPPEHPDDVINPDPEIRRLLASLQPPAHRPGFWSEMDEAMTPPGHQSHSRTRDRLLLVAAAAAVLVAAGAGLLLLVEPAGDETEAVEVGPEPTDPTTTPSTSTATTGTTVVTDETGSTTAPTFERPPTDGIPLVGELGDGTTVDEWSNPEPIDLDGFRANGHPQLLPGSLTSILHFEPNGVVEEGCEGGPEPARRLALTDVSTGERSVLVENLEQTDQAFELGPEGRIAMIGGCDANAWLEAVGLVTSDGTLDLDRLDTSPERRINGSNNAGVSATWTPDGRILYFNDIRVSEIDDRFGFVLPPSPWFDVDAPVAEGLRILGHLIEEDGTIHALVSRRGSGDADDFWLLSDRNELIEGPTGPPLFSGQALSPNADVAIAGDGSKILVNVDRWSDAERTYVLGFDPSDHVAVSGRATLSPDGTRILVRQPNGGGHVVVDLESGDTTRVPDTIGAQVLATWCCNGESILLFPFRFDQSDQGQPEITTIYRTDRSASGPDR